MFEEILPIIYNVIAGAGIGALVSLGGFFKNADENYDVKKAIETTLVGALVGGFGGYVGVNVEDLATYPKYGAAVVGLTWIAKGITRRIMPKINEWLSK